MAPKKRRTPIADSTPPAQLDGIPPKHAHKGAGTGGRPTKMTPELLARMVALCKGGNLPEISAAACGVPRATLHTWVRAGAVGRQKIADGKRKELQPAERRGIVFLDEIEAAVASAESADVLAVTKASAKDWRAAAWLLERRPGSKSRWQPTSKVEHEGVLGVADVGAGARAIESAKDYLARKLQALAEARTKEQAHAAGVAVLVPVAPKVEGETDPG